MRRCHASLPESRSQTPPPRKVQRSHSRAMEQPRRGPARRVREVPPHSASPVTERGRAPEFPSAVQLRANRFRQSADRDYDRSERIAQVPIPFNRLPAASIAQRTGGRQNSRNFWRRFLIGNEVRNHFDGSVKTVRDVCRLRKLTACDERVDSIFLSSGNRHISTIAPEPPAPQGTADTRPLRACLPFVSPENVHRADEPVIVKSAESDTGSLLEDSRSPQERDVVKMDDVKLSGRLSNL